MPRARLPPTPTSSADLEGQDGSKQLAGLQIAFELPPPAAAPSEQRSFGARLSPPVTSLRENPYQMQASEMVKARRRPSANQPHRDQLALPPPPTRSRKIIQVKPRQQGERTLPPSSSSKAAASGKPTSTDAAAGLKKKQPSTTTAAGRKIARKTAHSLIERRRRSKMNEEFGVLKAMVPACTGEMHKLAILQASIEYLRYLEDCVARLSSQQDGDPRPGSTAFAFPSDIDHVPCRAEPRPHTCTADGPQDVDADMGRAETPSLSQTDSRRSSLHSSTSPDLTHRVSEPHRAPRPSVSSDQRHYSFSTPWGTSPALGPQVYGHAHGSYSVPVSALTSPALAPQRDMDQEVTAALLMLNQSDRRGSSGRGISVRDLLST